MTSSSLGGSYVHRTVQRYRTLSLMGKHTVSSASARFTEAVVVPVALVLWTEQGPVTSQCFIPGFQPSKLKSQDFQKKDPHTRLLSQSLSI